MCLERLRDSVQQFSLTNYEVIVSDDGPVNNAKELIEKSFAWVKWVEGPKKGPAANRNNGAKNAKGNWLIFFDDDCLPDNNILKEYKLAIDKNEQIRVFEGKIISSLPFTTPLHYSPINLTGGYLWACNFAIEKLVFKDLRGFDENFKFPHFEDIDLLDRIKIKGYTPLFLPDAFVDHPPRDLSSGKKLGLHHESDYYYYQEKRNIKVSMTGLVKKILYARAPHFFKYKISKHSLLFIQLIISEIAVVILNHRKWKKAHPQSRIKR